MGVGVAAYAGCTDMKITHNVFDGSGSSNPCDDWSVIGTMGAGITLRYNWIKNFAQHVLEANGGGVVDYRYNLIEEGGLCSGAHLNYSQLQGSYISPRIAFNTFVQHVQAAGGEGIQVGGRLTEGITDARVEYNTMVSVPAGPRKALSYMIACRQGPRQFNDGFIARNNYLDMRGAFGPFYPGGRCAAASYTHNWDMVTGVEFRRPP